MNAPRSFFSFMMAYSRQIGNNQNQNAMRLENKKKKTDDKAMYKTILSTFILCRYVSNVAEPNTIASDSSRGLNCEMTDNCEKFPRRLKRPGWDRPLLATLNPAKPRKRPKIWTASG